MVESARQWNLAQQKLRWKYLLRWQQISPDAYLRQEVRQMGFPF